jgi:hypothetical protein
MGKCRQLIVAAAGVNLVKLVLEILLNTQNYGKETELPEIQINAQNTRKKILCLAAAKERVTFLFRFNCNNTP